MRKLPTTMTPQSVTGQSSTSSSFPSRLRVVHKLRGASSNNTSGGTSNNSHYNHNRILPPCPLYSNKSSTMANFDTNNNNKQNSKSKLKDYPNSLGLAESLLLDSIPSSSSPAVGRTRPDPISSSSNATSHNNHNNTTNSRQKEVNHNLHHHGMKETKNDCRKESSLDSFCCPPPNSGSFSHQHQDGTFSSTTLKEQENSFSSLTSEEYHAAEKAMKKSSKLHKMRHSSKSLAMNLNDMNIVGKKKTKIKRPLTSGNSYCLPPPSNCGGGTFTLPIQKITSTRIFNNNSKNSARKEKENVPPINKFLSLSQNQINSGHCDTTEKEDHHLYNKLKSQVHVAKTLQRQNVCLENIVTQKRNLVEQLTRQVRTLVRENQQLAKGISKLPQIETMMTVDCGPTTILPKMSPTTTVNLSSPQTCSESQTEIEMQSSSVNVESAGDSSEMTGKTGKERSVSTTGRKSSKPPSKKSESAEKLEETEQRLSTLSERCENMQQNYDHMKQENQEINRFLTNLLYTLNARGYESVTDHDGTIIDLYRCKGETFLDLKGRDARLRAPAKRLTPQETLLKAIIGSQERIIQNLISQLDDYQKDALLGARLSLESFNGHTESNRNAKLEGEVLSILGLLEGACQQNPEVYVTLKEQHAFDSQVKAHSGLTGLQSGNAIVEAVLERCQKVMSQNPLTTSSSPSSLINSKNSRRARDNLHHRHNNRSATPPSYHGRLSNIGELHRGGMIYSENIILQPPCNKTNNNNNCHPSTSAASSSKQALDHSTTTLGKNLGLSPRGQIFSSSSSSSPEPISSTTVGTRNYQHLPQISRSSTQSPFLKALGSSVIRTNHSNSNNNSNPLIVTNGLTPKPSPPPRLKPNSSSEVNRIIPTSSSTSSSSSSSNNNNSIPPLLLTEKNLACLTAGDRSPYCARQFSSSTSLAEINAHMEMHVFQG